MMVLPYWIPTLFIIATIYTILLFHFSNGQPTKLTLGIILYSVLQSGLSYCGFYHDATAMPPRFIFILAPTIFTILILLFSDYGKLLMEKRNGNLSILVHPVRIPVEIVLLHLYLGEAIPQLMTFEGRNFDIIAGISALVLGLYNMRKRVSDQVLLIWNIFGLALILFILLNGLLSARTPLQQFAMDQPNIAVEYFPYILLPAVIVPIVIFTHLTDILILRHKSRSD